MESEWRRSREYEYKFWLKSNYSFNIPNWNAEYLKFKLEKAIDILLHCKTLDLDIAYKYIQTNESKEIIMENWIAFYQPGFVENCEFHTQKIRF